ncbi:MAG: AzlC family ABC transporter permease, partial [Spirochaetota bacterium]
EARPFRPYLVYALTDETYGLLTPVAHPEGASKGAFFALVSALDQSYWVLGSLVGALAGALIPAEWTKGLDFALTALFIVLFVEQTRSVRTASPYLVALAACVIALLVVGPANLMVVAILLAILGILAMRPVIEGSFGGKKR